MAILSNINGKFAVDSTGAIQFSGAAGTNGYVLKSTGSGTAPTWVDPDTIIGPYLPLAGGTLTGATATASNIAFTVGGTLTVSGSGGSVFNSTGASNHIVAAYRATNGNNVTTFRTTDSGYIFRIHAQNSGTIYVQNDDGSNYLKIPDSGSNEVSGNTTFAGTITTTDVYGSSSLRLAALGGTAYLDSGSGSSVIIRTNGTTTALTLDSSQNATFSGEITSGDDINTPTKIVIGESASAELRLKKTDAGYAKISFYNNPGVSAQAAYISLDAAEDFTYYGASGVDQVFYAGGVLNLTLSGTTATFAGNVGIGTTPNTPLHVSSSSRPLVTLTSTSGDEYPGPIIYLNRESGSPADSDYIGALYFDALPDAGALTTFARIKGAIIDASDGDEEGAIVFDTTLGGNTNTEAMRIVGGNVGIGITTPQAKLQVNGAVNTFSAHFGGQNNTSGQFQGISLGYAEAGNAAYRKVGIVAQAKSDGAARQDLHFLVDTASDSGSAGIADSKMSIQYNTGDVIINNKLGIGTTSPSDYYADKFVVYDGDEGGMTIANSSTSGKSYLCFADGTSGAAAYTGYIAYDHNDNSMSFAGNGGNNRLTITSAGDVGIGKTNPSTHLDVQGVITAGDSTTDGAIRRQHQTFATMKPGPSSGSGVDMLFVDHTHTLDITVFAIIDHTNVATGRGYSIAAYGTATTGLTQTSFAGNISALSISYVNTGGSENYVLRVTCTYSGVSAPEICVTATGQSASELRAAT